MKRFFLLWAAAFFGLVLRGKVLGEVTVVKPVDSAGLFRQGVLVRTPAYVAALSCCYGEATEVFLNVCLDRVLTIRGCLWLPAWKFDVGEFGKAKSVTQSLLD